MTTPSVQSHKELIELNLVKENGMYFWGRAYVGSTKAQAIRTVLGLKAAK
jgi:hypothetical protein